MTRTVNTIRHIPDQDQSEVIEACKAAIREGNLVSVQVQDHSYGDHEETVLYGVYANTVDWVEQYYRSGGIWEYCDPERFLRG